MYRDLRDDKEVRTGIFLVRHGFEWWWGLRARFKWPGGVHSGKIE